MGLTRHDGTWDSSDTNYGNRNAVVHWPHLHLAWQLDHRRQVQPHRPGPLCECAQLRRDDWRHPGVGWTELQFLASDSPLAESRLGDYHIFILSTKSLSVHAQVEKLMTQVRIFTYDG